MFPANYRPLSHHLRLFCSILIKLKFDPHNPVNYLLNKSVIVLDSKYFGMFFISYKTGCVRRKWSSPDKNECKYYYHIIRIRRAATRNVPPSSHAPRMVIGL